MLQRELEWAKRAVAGGVLTLVQNDGAVQWAARWTRGGGRPKLAFRGRRGRGWLLFVCSSVFHMRVASSRMGLSLIMGGCYRNGWVGRGGDSKFSLNIRISKQWRFRLKTIRNSIFIFKDWHTIFYKFFLVILYFLVKIQNTLVLFLSFWFR